MLIPSLKSARCPTTISNKDHNFQFEAMTTENVISVEIIMLSAFVNKLNLSLKLCVHFFFHNIDSFFE